jgi:hypothetical protein
LFREEAMEIIAIMEGMIKRTVINPFEEDLEEDVKDPLEEKDIIIEIKISKREKEMEAEIHEEKRIIVIAALIVIMI